MALAHTALPKTLVITALEMTAPEEFRPSFVDNLKGVSLMYMSAPDVKFYRFLYGSVGEQWRWRDRLLLSDTQLEEILSSPNTSVHVMYVDGVPAGYIELGKDGDTTEIVYLGLRPEFMGRGLGKHLLSYGIARAWDEGAKRVWVHTCNLDAPAALENYQKRGFRVFHVDESPMPERYV